MEQMTVAIDEGITALEEAYDEWLVVAGTFFCPICCRHPKLC